MANSGWLNFAFESLPAGSNLASLRFDDTKTPDIVDEYSARLACTALYKLGCSPLLIVFPDEEESRSSFLFSSILIGEALGQFKSQKKSNRVLYVSDYPGVRSTLSRVKAGRTPLQEVFTTSYSRGEISNLPLRTSTLPPVTAVCNPAYPLTLFHQYGPRWVAVQCEKDKDPSWLNSMLLEAQKNGTPVIGWTSSPLSKTVEEWIRSGGSILKWPKRNNKAEAPLKSLEDLFTDIVKVEITPCVIENTVSYSISDALTLAIDYLLKAKPYQTSKLANEATLLGWRYLKALETLVVPFEIYEQQAEFYWGAYSFNEYSNALTKYIDSLKNFSPDLHKLLNQVELCLEVARDSLTSFSPPFWEALIRICEGGDTPKEIVFSSLYQKKMFIHSLLAKQNLTQDDLAKRNIFLNDLLTLKNNPSTHYSKILVGLPSSYRESRLEGLFEHNFTVLILPHQKAALKRKASFLSEKLGFNSHELGDLLWGFDKGREQEVNVEGLSRLTVASEISVSLDSFEKNINHSNAIEAFWTQPSIDEVVKNLFQAEEHSHVANEKYQLSATETDLGKPIDNSIIVDHAIKVKFKNGKYALFTADDKVNLITKGSDGKKIEEVFVRSLQPNNEILFIEGQGRQDLYELIISRVHGTPSVAHYMELVNRWHDELYEAFKRAQKEGLTIQELTNQIRMKGSSITSSQSVKNWILRYVIAPHDPEDLKRVAETLSLDFSSQSYKIIHRAASSLRGIHIRLSVRLNKWLTNPQVADEVIDEKLNLTFEDFRHSLVQLVVVDVAEVSGPFCRDRLGRIEEG